VRKATGSSETARSGRALVIVVVVVLVLAAGGGAAWWFLLRSTPEKTAEAYLAADRARDVEKLKSLLSSKTLTILEDAAPPPGLARMLAGAPGVETQVGKASVQGDKATVPFETKMGEGQALPGFPDSVKDSMKLVREGAEWKIDLSDYLKELKQFAWVFGCTPEETKELVKEVDETLERARQKIAEAAAKGPAKPPAGDAAALLKEGLAAKKVGQLDKAVSNLKAAIAQDPNNVDAHWALAWVLADQKKTEEAVSHFEKVIEFTDDQQRKNDAHAAVERLR
jgi:hypothetical protein